MLIFAWTEPSEELVVGKSFLLNIRDNYYVEIGHRSDMHDFQPRCYRWSRKNVEVKERKAVKEKRQQQKYDKTLLIMDVTLDQLKRHLDRPAWPKPQVPMVPARFTRYYSPLTRPCWITE
jgi:hypothetical protein